ncbi:MAG TPA: hypothetical protein VN643_18220 [Pyrinomonadaceae bacterium]|nr:hypothetical protein [Pyrinomonadaceae bacterium]
MNRIAIPKDTATRETLGIQPLVPAIRSTPNQNLISNLDAFLVALLHRWSVPALRAALGLVFLWFGALKVLGVSPVEKLIHQSYPFLPLHQFVLILGVWEILVGLGLLLKRGLRCALILMLFHLVGTFMAVCLAPSEFFSRGIPFFLTVDGEFVIKNMILIAAGLVIAGYELRPLRLEDGGKVPEGLFSEE